MPSSLLTKTLEQRQQLMQRKLEEECPTSTATEMTMWSPIVKRGGHRVDCKDCKEGRARYTSRSNFFIRYMEEKDSVGTTRHRTAQDLWLGWLASLTDSDDSFQHLKFTPCRGRRYLLTGEDVPGQKGQKGFQSLKNPHLGIL